IRGQVSRQASPPWPRGAGGNVRECKHGIRRWDRIVSSQFALLTILRRVAGTQRGFLGSFLPAPTQAHPWAASALVDELDAGCLDGLGCSRRRGSTAVRTATCGAAAGIPPPPPTWALQLGGFCRADIENAQEFWLRFAKRRQPQCY